MPNYYPLKHRDASAEFEARLANQLRAADPAFSTVCVDLEPFEPLKAKIDCITVAIRGIRNEDITMMNQAMCGTVKRISNLNTEVAIHDPTPADLRYLFDHYPAAPVYYLEIAVDIFLPDRSNKLYLLRGVKEQFRHCLAPGMHEAFQRSDRQYCTLPRRKLRPDSNRNPTPLTTIYFDSRTNGLRTKLYLKTLDQNRHVQNPCVRIEFSLKNAAPGHAGLNRIGDLPIFASNLRKYCSPAFYTAKGIKGRGDRDGLWIRHGANLVIANTKDLSLQPDAAANRAIGNALHELGRKLRSALDASSVATPAFAARSKSPRRKVSIRIGLAEKLIKRTMGLPNAPAD